MITLINAHIFNPAYKTVKARCELTFCDNSEKCPLLKSGKCVQSIGVIQSTNCPHGKNRVETGYTRKARGFSKWVSEKQTQYKDVLEKLDNRYAYKQLVDLGDYVYLPYPYITNWVNSLPFIVNGHFCKKEDFTLENILFIINYKPQAMMGGTITEFQTVEVPRFIDHLRSEIPEIYQKLIEKYPEIKTKFSKDKINYVKRIAILSTVKKGSIFKDRNNNILEWDGEHFICENWRNPFLPFRCQEASIEAKPKENETIEITDNNQVDENTRFVD